MSAIKPKHFQTLNAISGESPKAVHSTNIRSCLICHKRLKAATKSAPLLDNNSPEEKLNQLASVFEFSSSIYREVDLNDIPVPLLCLSCSQTVLDAFKVQSAMKTLQEQLARLTEIIRWDIIQSFHLDTQTHNNEPSADCGQVKLIRKTYAQCWGSCQVRTTACEIPRETPSLSNDVVDDLPSPFYGCADEEVGESDGNKEYSEDETCRNPDAVKSEVAENDMATMERKLTGESINLTEIPSQPQMNESVPLVETLPSSNNAMDDTIEPTSGVISSNSTTTIRGRHKCHLCGVNFTKGTTLKNHLTRRKFPCVRRNLLASTDSSLVGERRDDNAKGKIASPTSNIGIPATCIIVNKTSVAPIEIQDDSVTAIRSTRNKARESYNETSESGNSGDVLNCDSDSLNDEFEEREPKRMKAIPNRRSRVRQTSGVSQKSNMKCPKCSLSFSSILNLKLHRKEVHGDVSPIADVQESRRKFKCAQCDRSYKRQSTLNHHVRRVHLGTGKGLACNLCDKTFTWEHSLKIHVENKHGQRSECTLCGEIVHVEKLQHHIELHNGSKDFPCKQCNARLPTYRSCIFHIRMYHSNGKYSNKMIKCKRCSREFRMFPELLEHRKVHLKKSTRAFLVPCTLCDSKFKTEERLLRHIRFHVNGSKTFKCDFCNQTFEKLHHAKVHMKIKHSQERQVGFKCTLCGHTLPTQKRLNEHVSLHNGEEDFPCKECPMRCSTEISLKGHIIRHHQTRQQCGMCKQTCSNFAELCAHKKSEHGISINFAYRMKAHKCTICPKAFTNKKMLKVHMMRHGGKENFNCTLCDAVFMTSAKMMHHLRLVHEKGIIPVERSFNFQCNICKKGFEWKEMYEWHMKKHENPDEIISRFIQAKVNDQKNVISFDCQVCKQTFCKESNKNEDTNQFEIICQHGNCNCKASYTDLKNYMYHHKKVCQLTYHRANFDMRVTCDECGKILANPRLLQTHKHRVHPGPDSLMCQFCGRAYGKRHMLEDHLAIHSSEKNFQCHVCGSKFKGKKLLIGHIKRCHSDAQFPCDICGKTFKTAANVLNHKVTHSSLGPQFPCRICGKFFKSKTYVLNHIYSTHEKRRKPRDRKPPSNDGESKIDNSMECSN